jgi:hypothetical protein
MGALPPTVFKPASCGLRAAFRAHSVSFISFQTSAVSTIILDRTYFIARGQATVLVANAP